jgi:hypothetical protein
MGYYVHLSVVFACDKNEGVAALAAKHLAALPDEDANFKENGTAKYLEDLREARWFLEDLSVRSGGNRGPKGGLSLWGIVGNYTTGVGFVDTLKPFWSELLNEVPGGPLRHERIIVFVEPEQTDAAQAFEIGLEDLSESDSGQYEYGPLVVTHHEGLPFSWGQS